MITIAAAPSIVIAIAGGMAMAGAMTVETVIVIVEQVTTAAGVTMIAGWVASSNPKTTGTVIRCGV